MVSQGLKNNLRLFGLLTVLTGAFLGIGQYLAGTTGLIIALVFAAALNFVSYWFSDTIVLKIYGAEEVSEQQNPELHRIVEELAENAGIPKPRIYRNSMRVPNAFATGRSPRKGVVCVTDGLIRELDREEIAGVIAHELAHIKNRDTLINASVATIAGAIAVIARIVFWSAMFSGREDEGNLLASAAFMILVPIIALLIRMAISRRMEFRADSTGVQIHGQKDGLVSALEKISHANNRTHYKASQVQETGSNLFIENPFTGDKLTSYFSTHPPLDKRVENIQTTELS